MATGDELGMLEGTPDASVSAATGELGELDGASEVSMMVATGAALGDPDGASDT